MVGRVSPLRAVMVNQNAPVSTGGSQRTAIPNILECADVSPRSLARSTSPDQKALIDPQADLPVHALRARLGLYSAANDSPGG